MTKKADIGSKRLISLAPNPWVRWITQRPELHVEEILNTEFQWIDRESDVLLKVYSPQIGEFLLLNELQIRYNSKMPRRLRAYTALAEERVNLVFQQKIATLLPFVPILKGGNTEKNLRQAVIELRKDEKLNELEPLLSFFASFVLDIPLI